MVGLALIVMENGPNREAMDWLYAAAQLKYRPALDLAGDPPFVFLETRGFFYSPERVMAGGK
jgi:hypothetical protein